MHQHDQHHTADLDLTITHVLFSMFNSLSTGVHAIMMTVTQINDRFNEFDAKLDKVAAESAATKAALDLSRAQAAEAQAQLAAEQARLAETEATLADVRAQLEEARNTVPQGVADRLESDIAKVDAIDAINPDQPAA